MNTGFPASAGREAASAKAPGGLALCAFSLSLLSGCIGGQPLSCGLSPVLETLESGAVLSLDTCSGGVGLGNWEDPVAWLGPPPEGRPALAVAVDEIEYSMVQGRYTFAGTWGAWEDLGGAQQVAINRWQSEGERPYLLQINPGPHDSIRLRLEVDAEVDRVSVAFSCRDGERFYGLGAQPQGTDHTGRTALLYTAEQGIGQEDYFLDETYIFEGRIGDSYYPVPWTVTDRGLGLGIQGDSVARMYLCGAEEPGVLRMEAWGSVLELSLFPAGSPRQAVQNWTLSTGPPAAAPDWAYGPWIGVQRGTQALLDLVDVLRQYEISASALWAQDWIGGRDQALIGYDLNYHWEWDEETYPELPKTINRLHKEGLAFLGYFNPFVTDAFDEWTEARDGGFLPRKQDGEPYTFSIIDRFGSVVDLENAEARDWAKTYLEAATEMEQDGWMCDFGEWMPMDAVVGDGLSGRATHNAYPLKWHELNMEVLNESWGEGNALCFGRSGWTGDHATTPVTWGGDQETSWARDDGLPSAREIGVGLGLSGVGRYGSDIAGFSSLWNGNSDEELYSRWVSMGAFEPVMRTHDGVREGENWHWQNGKFSIGHFARYSRLHLRLLPLWRALDRAYTEEGLPFLRHSILVESGSGEAAEALRDAPDQHFLGDDLLVAPVLEEGATSRSVRLPPGRWYSLLGDAIYEGGEEGASVEVAAPITEIPVLARAGSLVPLLPEGVQTSYPTARAGIVDASDVAGQLDLWVFDGEAGELVMADGSQWRYAGGGEVQSSGITLDGSAVAESCEGATSSCVESLSEDRLVLRVDWPSGGGLLDGGGWTLSSDAPAALSSSITLRFAPGSD